VGAGQRGREPDREQEADVIGVCRVDVVRQLQQQRRAREDRVRVVVQVYCGGFGAGRGERGDGAQGVAGVAAAQQQDLRRLVARGGAAISEWVGAP
jgi:hypothetical protein